MKLARCADTGGSYWALVDGDLGTAQRIEGEFAEWAPALTRGIALPPMTGDTRPLSDIRLLAPLPNGARVVAAGATYAKHIEGLGLQMPKAPSAFLKTAASVIAPSDSIRYPGITEQLDYEGELVVVIGDDVDQSCPVQSVLGYTIGNDVSARDQQFSGGVTGMDMFSAKALDGTSGLGPWIVTRDEFGDGHPDLELRTTVDGETRQHARTGSMVWGTSDLVTYVDQRVHLKCGDILFTGTCAGVGHEDGRYLEPGQVVTVSIERIGELVNTVGPRPR